MGESVAINALRLQQQSCENHTGPKVRFSHNGMMEMDWIRNGLKKPGKSQRGLAAAMGIDPTAVSRMLSGNRQLKASEIEKVRIYLELPLATSHLSSSSVDAPMDLRAPVDATSRSVRGSEELLKVLGMAEGGPDGWNLWNGDVIQYVKRPENLIGVKHAYAVYIRGSSMEPRYEPGELVHIHPAKPVQPGSYVLVQRKPANEGEPPLAIVKRLVKRSGDKVTLEQFNPRKTFTVLANEIVSMHRVVGSSEA